MDSKPKATLEPECEYCDATAPYLCQGCGDPVCEAKHSVPTPEGGRLCPDCEDTAAAEPAGDPFWNCPEHQAELVYDHDQSENAGDRQEYWKCPVTGCKFGRWIS